MTPCSVKASPIVQCNTVQYLPPASPSVTPTQSAEAAVMAPSRWMAVTCWLEAAQDGPRPPLQQHGLNINSSSAGVATYLPLRTASLFRAPRRCALAAAPPDLAPAAILPRM